MSLSQPIHNEDFYSAPKKASVIALARPSLKRAESLSSLHSIITLPTMPYALNALTPYISANALTAHYEKYYLDSVENLNSLIVGTSYQKLSLESIIKESAKRKLVDSRIYDSAAYIWLCAFYWNSLKPKSGDRNLPSGHLLRLIDRDFGHFSDTRKNDNGTWVNPGFKQKLFDAGINHSGSGWLWLVMNKGKLEIITSSHTEVFFTEGLKPLLAVALSEQFYGMDYAQTSNDYLNAVLDNLIYWEFAAKNLRKIFW